MNEKSLETVSRKPAGFFSRTLALVVDLFLLAILGLMSGVVIFLVAALAMGVVGLSLEPKPEKRNYLVLPLLMFYNVFLDGIRIMSLVEDMINIIMEWEKPKR